MGIEVSVLPDEFGDNSKLKTDPNTGILLRPELNEDLTINTIFNTELSDAIVSIPVGGADSKTVSYWKSQSLVKVLMEIMFPDLMASYVLPTLEIVATTDTTLYEVGVIYTKAFVLKAIKNDGGAFTNMVFIRNNATIWSGLPTPVGGPSLPAQYNFANPNNPNWQYEHVYNESIALIKGVNSWQCGGFYGAGIAKKHNKGATDGRTPAVLNPVAPQAAGGIYTSDFIITADYPIFWGVSDTLLNSNDVKTIIQSGLANKVLISAAEDLNINFGAVGQYLWFAYWSGYTTKSKWSVEGMNVGEIGGSTNLFGSYAQQFVDSPSGYWAGIGFKIHISNYPTTINDVITLRNT